MTFAVYYWISFAVTLAAALYVPTKLSPVNNVVGSALAALIGFAFWPICVLAAIQTYRRNRNGSPASKVTRPSEQDAPGSSIGLGAEGEQ